MGKKVVTGLIFFLIVIVILLGIVRYRTVQQDNSPSRKGTLVKIWEDSPEDRRG